LTIRSKSTVAEIISESDYDMAERLGVVRLGLRFNDQLEGILGMMCPGHVADVLPATLLAINVFPVVGRLQAFSA
jgi:hypothetical protein